MRGVGAITIVAAVLFVAAPAQATHVSCGQTITTDTVLDSDLDCPTGHGIRIAASGVDLDLDGHTVRGETDLVRSSTFGIWAHRDYSGISVTNGTVIGFQSAIYLYGVRNSTVSGMEVEGDIALGGQPTNNVIEDNVVTAEANQFPMGGGIEVNESFWIGDETFRPANNRVLNNTTASLRLDLVDRNEVRGNHVVEGPLVLVGFAQTPHFFEGNGADENVIVDNRVDSSRTFPGYGILLAQACRRNIVERNEITGPQPRGILVTVGCADNVIRGNSIAGATRTGIQLGDPPYRTSGNVVDGNTVRDSTQDGIAATSGADHSLLRSNVVSGNGDDGIDMEDASATVTANSAHDNADWGIEAVAGTIDGGANRAWSNGQPAQCLNVVCGPGPPASLSLSPESATNTVGDEHCVTATVADPDGRATPGVTVRFAVNDDGTASVPTDAGGTATYCYEGPVAPRTDEISAFADDDDDGSQDAGEPGATASKSWVLPEPSERCAVIGIGSIVASNGDRASFRINVHVHKDRSRGSLFYEDAGPADSLLVRSSRLSSITCSQESASIFGRTHGSVALSFRIDVTDAGAGGDRYRIRTSNGYDSGERPLTSGNVRVR